MLFFTHFTWITLPFSRQATTLSKWRGNWRPCVLTANGNAAKEATVPTQDLDDYNAQPIAFQLLSCAVKSPKWTSSWFAVTWRPPRTSDHRTDEADQNNASAGTVIFTVTSKESRRESRSEDFQDQIRHPKASEWSAAGMIWSCCERSMIYHLILIYWPVALKLPCILIPATTWKLERPSVCHPTAWTFFRDSI